LKFKRAGRYTFAAVLFLSVFFVISCKPRVYKRAGLLKSIPLHIIIVSRSEPKWDVIFKYVDSQTGLLDHRNISSPLYKLNSTGRAVMPDEIIGIIREAVKIAGESGGAFDPTIFPLTKLWDFDHGGKLPEKKEIERIKKLVNYKLLKISDNNTVVLPKGMGLDLGGIAKGAIVDGIADYLNKLGYSQFLIEAGGDILMQGLKLNAKWKIGIKHPRKDNEYVTIVSLGRKDKDKNSAAAARASRISIVTSGDYERYFEKNGVRYNHIINPASGYPAHGAVSVTVISNSCMRADALSTAAFVLGYKKGLEFLKKQIGTSGLIIREENGKLQAEETNNFPAVLDDLDL